MAPDETLDQGLLELNKVTKVFGGLTAVDNVSFSVRKGEILGLIGPNGAGKSTVVGLVMGVLKPNSGDIFFKGENLAHFKPHRVVERGICRTFQVEKPLLNMTVTGNVLIGALLRTADRGEALKQTREIIERVRLGRVGHVLAKNLTVQDRKRLELARALATRPTMLLLDEVMAELDAKRRAYLLARVNSANQSLITSTGLELFGKEFRQRAQILYVVAGQVRELEARNE